MTPADGQYWGCRALGREQGRAHVGTAVCRAAPPRPGIFCRWRQKVFSAPKRKLTECQNMCFTVFTLGTRVFTSTALGTAAQTSIRGDEVERCQVFLSSSPRAGASMMLTTPVAAMCVLGPTPVTHCQAVGSRRTAACTSRCRGI